MFLGKNALDLSKLAEEAALALDKNNIAIATHCINLIVSSQDIQKKIDALASVACKAIEKKIFIAGVIDASCFVRIIIQSPTDQNTKINAINALSKIAKAHIRLFQFPPANELVNKILYYPADDNTKTNALVDIAKENINITNIPNVFLIINIIRGSRVEPRIKAGALQDISKYFCEKGFLQQADQIITIAQNIR